MNRHITVTAIAIVISVFGGPAWSAGPYVVTDLGTFGGSFTNAMGLDINNNGQVAGWSYTAGYADERAFLWSNGTMTDLGTLGGHYSGAMALNNNGQVVGSAHTASNNYHAFLYGGGTMKDLGTLGGIESYASDINDYGVVVGRSFTNIPGDAMHGFIYSNGTMQDLPLNGMAPDVYGINNDGQVVGDIFFPGAFRLHAFVYSNGTTTDLGVLPGMERSQANAINRNGDIVGISDNVAGTYRAVLWSNGTMTDLGTLPGFESSSQAVDINASGQIVGVLGDWTQTPYRLHAFLCDQGTMFDLNDLVVNLDGWTLQVAESINDSGQIVGYGTRDGNTRAFLLSPVPEPSALLLAAVGLVGLLMHARRK
jgi:probable HAF family extracellular repeat protein